MAPGLLRPLGAPANPTSPRAQRAAQSARRGEPQPRSTATSLDLGAQAPRATEAAPSPDGSWPFSHSNFPPRALGAFPAPGLEVHSPAAAKGQGREESGVEAGGGSPRQPPAVGNLEGALESAARGGWGELAHPAGWEAGAGSREGGADQPQRPGSWGATPTASSLCWPWGSHPAARCWPRGCGRTAAHELGRAGRWAPGSPRRWAGGPSRRLGATRCPTATKARAPLLRWRWQLRTARLPAWLRGKFFFGFLPFWTIRKIAPWFCFSSVFY